MKNNTKRFLALLLAICLAAALMGCSLTEKEPAAEETEAPTDETASEYSEEERAEVAVQVGDYTVTKGEIIDQYDYLISMYSYYGYSTPTADADVESFQDTVVSQLTSRLIQLYQADLMGVELSEEKLASIKEEAQQTIDDYTAQYRDLAEDEGASDLDARAEELFVADLEASGMNMDIAGFYEYVVDEMSKSARIEALEAKVKEDVTATDEEIQTAFDELLATQKETYAATPETYQEDAESFEMYGGDPVLVVPEGYLRVRTITISPAEEIGEEYTTLKTELTELESQYGTLLLNALAEKYANSNADPAATTLNVPFTELDGGAEIVKSYIEKKAQADALFEAYIADARAKADTALAAIKGGMSFADAIKEYGEDDMYVTYPSFLDTGLVMYSQPNDTWSDALLEAVKTLQPGEYTDVIRVDDMFYILQLVGDEPAGEKTLADVSDALRASVVSEKAETYWNEKLDEWENDTSLATYFEDVYRDVGKAVG